MLYEVDHYNFIADKCWYRGVCGGCGTEKCDRACGTYLRMYFLIYNAGLNIRNTQPSNLILNDIGNENEFARLNEIKSDIKNWIEEGNNLYIFSKNGGTGKTTWSIKLLCAYFASILGEYDDIEDDRGLFVSVTELLRLCSMNRFTTKLDGILTSLKDTPVLVLDGIGCKKSTDFDNEVLQEIINSRQLNMKSTIYTSNLRADQLAGQLDIPLADRIFNNSEVIQFVGYNLGGTK